MLGERDVWKETFETYNVKFQGVFASSHCACANVPFNHIVKNWLLEACQTATYL